MDTIDPKTKVADLTGIAPAEIGKSILQVDILKREGVLINLDISGTSMFVTGVDWGELGINDDSSRAARMSPGRKWLYPKAEVNRLSSVVSAMRQALERYSYDLTGFRPARYMHYKAYPSWKVEWDALTARFAEVKTALIDIHDQAVDALAEEFHQIAAEAWQSAQGTGSAFIVFNKVAYDDLDAFTDAVMARALSKMPGVDQIEEGLHADYKVSMLYGLDDIAREEETARKLREQAAVEREAAELLKHEAYLKDAAAQEQFNHEQRMLRLEEQEKELSIEAMMHAEAEHAREQLKQLTSPFAEVFISLRNQIAEDAQAMLESIKKNTYCRGKVAERGLKLIDIYNMMSVQDDAELHSRLIALRNAIGTVGDDRPKDAPERDTQQIVDVLESIKDLAHQAAQDLASGPSRFAFAE